MKKTVIFLLIIYSGILLLCKPKEEKTNIKENQIDLSSFKPLVSVKGKIVFQSDMDGDNEIYLLTKKGLKKLTNNSWSDEYPKWSPNGKKIVFMSNPKGNYDIFVMDIDGFNLKQLTSSQLNEKDPVWLPKKNKIAFTVERKGFIRKKHIINILDLKTMEKKNAMPLYQGLNALPNFSPSGFLMGFTGKRTVGWDVAIYDFRTGKVSFLTEGGKACRPHFSHDGKKIAYVSSIADGKGDIWIMNPDGSSKMRLTRRNETYDYFPSWSPDDKFIVFSSSTRNHKLRGNWALYLINVSTGKASLLLDTPGRDLFPDWH